MKNIISKVSIYLLIAGLVISCDEVNTDSQEKNLDFVKYGTSFGECLGYCVKSTKVTDSKIEFEKNGWNLDGLLPTVQHSENMNEDFFTILKQSIDFNKFMDLDSVLGCPDCADGGAEWIEIKQLDITHKVTFEYGHEPELLKGSIGVLRTYLNSVEPESKQTIGFNERTLINKEGKIKNFICSRACNQYLIELRENNKTTYYYDRYLDSEFHVDGMSIRFNGVLQHDSTMINKPAPNDIPIPDFKANNINIYSIIAN